MNDASFNFTFDATTAITPDFCKSLEAYETDEWAVKAILEVEGIWGRVLDPCAGFGMLGKALIEAGYGRDWFEIDVFPWWNHVDRSRCCMREVRNFFELTQLPPGVETVLMNPPFELAPTFVSHALVLGARKIIAFQRHAWWESLRRESFWHQYPPNRIYSCRRRATCMRFDITLGMTERPEGNSPHAHSWFIWERGHPPGTLLGHIG